MRTLTLLFASIWCPLIAFSQEKTGIEKLVSSYEDLQKTSKDSIAQRIFFTAYPANFEELQSCFVSNRFCTTELDAIAYLNAFKKLTYISEVEKIHRLFNIIVGAHWQADAYNYHLQYMRTLMGKNVQRAFTLIAAESETRQILFWQAYWQGPALDISQQKDYALYNSISGHKKEKQRMKEAFLCFRAKLPIKD